MGIERMDGAEVDITLVGPGLEVGLEEGREVGAEVGVDVGGE